MVTIKLSEAEEYFYLENSLVEVNQAN